MNLNTFQKTAILTVCATLFLIFVGGLVRASGAGLGCPDWPTCFGLWIPPLSLADLPSNFSPDQFNVVKTWTEYVNRLIGVLIGLLIILTFILSIRYRKEKPSITITSGMALILVIFQGWLGGMVVRSGLTEWIITIHMIVAMVLVGLLIFATFKAFSDTLNVHLPANSKRKYSNLIWLLLLLTMIQMGLGTQVREAIDMISKNYPNLMRSEWLNNAGIIDEIHRTFSWTVLIVSGYLSWFTTKGSFSRYFKTITMVIFGMILLQVIIGIVLAYGGLPAAFQVLHLFGSALLISTILLALFSAKEASIDPEGLIPEKGV